MRENINHFLFVAGTGSSACYPFLENISSICAKILPITGVLTFLIYIVINKAAIAALFKNKQNGKLNKRNK